MDLVASQDQLVKNLDSAHAGMLENITKNWAVIEKVSANFGKSQSQFIDNMLTVSHPTPYRNIRQIMAEINKSKSALVESHFNKRKKEIEIKMMCRTLKNEKDELKREMIEVEIAELKSQIDSINYYVKGAIRKVKNYLDQYNAIVSEVGELDEKKFEEEEEKYHIKKAFEQALCAARSRGGIIDEGNHIYLMQIGINGAMAQTYISQFLLKETQLIQSGKPVSHLAVLNFLEEMYQSFKGSAVQYSKFKHMTLKNETALLNDETGQRKPK